MRSFGTTILKDTPYLSPPYMEIWQRVLLDYIRIVYTTVRHPRSKSASDQLRILYTQVHLRIVSGNEECLIKSIVLILCMTNLLHMKSRDIWSLVHMLFATSLTYYDSLDPRRKLSSQSTLIRAIRAALIDGEPRRIFVT